MSGTKLVASRRLPQPVEKEMVEVDTKKGMPVIGKQFKQDRQQVLNALASLSREEVIALESQLKESGNYILKAADKQFTVTAEMVEVKRFMKTVHEEEFVPSVIEPSFGIGRIMYSIFEHRFRVRPGDEQRSYLSLPPVVAPYKCSILPLSANTEFFPFVRQLSEELTKLNISHKTDVSGVAIGRRYARTDQIAIPFAITVDFDTVNKSPATATLRERDSMKQIRAKIEDLPKIVADLSSGQQSWENVVNNYPVFEQQETG